VTCKSGRLPDAVADATSSSTSASDSNRPPLSAAGPTIASRISTSDIGPSRKIDGGSRSANPRSPASRERKSLRAVASTRTPGVPSASAASASTTCSLSLESCVTSSSS
jgi:hypothetical protein